MVAKKRGLGRGLEALLPKEKGSGDKSQAPAAAKGGLDDIPLEWIKPGKYQPRSYFGEESIAELAASIKAQGLMQPIVLRALPSQGGEDRYEIIAGERRWRAAQLAGLDKISAVIREVDDESALAMSLIENIQREDLNPLEEAVALQRLIEEFQLTHQQVADAVGRSRSAVSNTLRLTQLSQGVIDMLSRGDLEMGHARALLSLDSGRQGEVARTVVAKGLSVRQTEDMVRKLGHDSPGKPTSAAPIDSDTRRLEDKLGQKLGQPVQIKHSSKGRGKLIISYNSLDELDGVLGIMGYEE